MLNDLSSHIHWLAVLAGAAAYWLLGAIWYSPLLFVVPWAKMVNLKLEHPSKKGMPMLFMGSFVVMFIASTGLGILMVLINIPDVMHAVKLGLLVSVFFSFTSSSIGYLYTRKSISLYAIDGGYHIIGTVLAAVVIRLLS